jgi:hypothetical protein
VRMSLSASAGSHGCEQRTTVIKAGQKASAVYLVHKGKVAVRKPSMCVSSLRVRCAPAVSRCKSWCGGVQNYARLWNAGEGSRLGPGNHCIVGCVVAAPTACCRVCRLRRYCTLLPGMFGDYEAIERLDTFKNDIVAVTDTALLVWDREQFNMVVHPLVS